jgi:2'-deoxynucleoside 5'-phosphate N-hydrolase
MKIYFSCSITGGRGDQPIYAALVESLQSAGHEVLTAQLSSADIMKEERVISAAEVYERDVRWVNECDALIAEVSTPSHGVGYEIALALHLEKPVLCCYHTDRSVSKMILGNNHPGLSLAEYRTVEELLQSAAGFLNNLSIMKAA